MFKAKNRALINKFKKSTYYKNYLKRKKRLQYRKELLIYKRICYKWRLFFVWKKWLTKRLINLRFFIWNKNWSLSYKYTYKKKLVSKKRNLFKKCDIKGYKKFDFYSNKKKPYKGYYKYFSLMYNYRYWKAIKKRRNKRFKIWYNFFFYFSKLYRNKLPALRSYFGSTHENRYFVLNNPDVIAHKPHRKTILKRFDQRVIIRIKKKSWFSTKKNYWKKLMIKKFFMGFYYITTLKKLKYLTIVSKKKFGSRAYNFYYFMESRVIPTCFRLGFFWNKRRGFNWVYWGFIYLNGRLVKTRESRVPFNSIIRIIVPYNIWRFWTKTKTSIFCFWKFKSFNNIIEQEFSLKYYFSLILDIPRSFRGVNVFFWKRKKQWFNLKTFSYIASAYY